MSYFSEQLLRSYNTDIISKSVERTMIKEASSTKNTVFLSFSHKDIGVALGLKNYLASLRLNLYLDVFDADLSSNTNHETAERIKERIKALKYFFLLATNNSVRSRWVPWELGIADGSKGTNNIFIIPVTDDKGEFNGNEYLKIYQRIVLAKDNVVGIFNPSDHHNGTLLESLFR